jgi:hypothetical protein
MKKAPLLQNPIFRRCSSVETDKNPQCIAADASPVFLRLHGFSLRWRTSTEPRIFSDEALFITLLRNRGKTSRSGDTAQRFLNFL